MIRKRLKTSFRSDNPLVQRACAGLNELGEWANVFGAIQPLVVAAVPGGVKLRWEPWDSPFLHPWRVGLQDGTGKVDVAGGNVNTGASLNAVTGLSNVTAADGLKVWLKVKHYYNTATASTYTLGSTTGAWPTSTHNATYVETVLKVAEIVGSTLYQYLYEDQFVPRIEPPLPDTTNTYFLMSVAGVVQWVQSGSCP